MEFVSLPSIGAFLIALAIQHFRASFTGERARAVPYGASNTFSFAPYDAQLTTYIRFWP